MVGASFVTAVAEVIRSKKGITAVGNAQVDIAQSKFGGASALFDGSGDYLNLTTDPAYTFAGDFTVECWYRLPGAVPGIAPFFFNDHLFYLTNDGGVAKYAIFSGGNNRLLTGSVGTVSSGVWYHVAFVRSGSTLAAYHNGVSAGTSTYSSTMTSQANNYIGFYPGSTFFNGHIDEYRISKNARYTANFTPATQPFVNDDNTVLLIHADGTDASTFFEDDNGISRVPMNGWQPESGVVISSTQSKFGGTSLYTPGNATLYHNQFSGAGNGNALINFGTGNFTVEFWIYPTATSTTAGVITKRNISNVANGTWGVFYNGSTRTVNWQNIFPSVTTTSTASAIFSLNTWSHWAFVRSSGTFKIYIDGVERASASNSLDFTFNSEPIRIGDWDTGGGNGHIGYLDEIRMSNSARYTANFTPATAPFTNDENTLLLLHMDGTPSVAVFRDDNGARAQRSVVAVNNAQIDTAQSKFGGASALFDGNGDFLIVNTSSNIQYNSTSTFTIECWLRTAALNNTSHLIATYGVTSPFAGWALRVDETNNRLSFWDGVAWRVFNSNSLTTNIWYHAAIVSIDGSVKLYLDGTQQTTTFSLSSSITSTNNIYIGTRIDGNNGFNGHIDELRISNSARYTANFTAPTAPFQNDDNTVLLLHMDGTDASTVFFDDNGRTPTP
jgi:hypothetical protein